MCSYFKLCMTKSVVVQHGSRDENAQTSCSDARYILLPSSTRETCILFDIVLSFTNKNLLKYSIGIVFNMPKSTKEAHHATDRLNSHPYQLRSIETTQQATESVTSPPRLLLSTENAHLAAEPVPSHPHLYVIPFSQVVNLPQLTAL